MKFDEKFKKDFLNELNSPDQAKAIKDKIGIESTDKVVDPKPSSNNSFWSKILKHKAIWISCLSCLLVVALGIGGTFGYIKFKNTPVYEGMEVTSQSGKLTSYSLTSDEEGKDIEDAVEESIEPIIPEGIAYYAKKGQKIEITVKISNPKFYEILSFTLNGKLYQTFEFKEGSNSEQIIVDFVCQDESGLQVVTIDAIKYVEGTKIKDVRFKGDKELTLGITYEELPQVTNLSEIIGTTEFGLSFVTTDINNLIDLSSGLMMYIFDGEKIINISNLNLGMNVFPFSNLRMGKEYQYAVVGVYDALDGRGKCANILASNKFVTKEGIEVSDLEIGYDNIKVTFNRIHKEDITVNKIFMSDGEETVEGVLNPDGTYSFGDLLSNKEYVLTTTYGYNIVENGEVVTLEHTIQTTVKTKERPIPTIEFKDFVADKESVKFNFEINDTVATSGKIISLKLFLHGNLIKELDPSDLEILDLLSNTEYELEVTYEYDLKDGNPRATITNSIKFKTLEKVTPVVKFTQAVGAFNNMFSAWFEINDPEGCCNIERFELYNEAGELVATKDVPDNYHTVADDEDCTGQGDVTFYDLTEPGLYKIVVVYSYDLNDGKGKIVIDANSIAKDNSIKADVQIN